MRLTTPRLTLRSARADDLEAFHRILSDPRATRWWSTPPHETLDQTQAWLTAMIDKGPDNPDFVIERDGALIGKAGFFALPEIGCILHPDHWGQGLAREAVEAAIDHVWATRDLQALEAEVDPDNTASIRLLEHMGFRRVGFRAAGIQVGGAWMDCVDYALAREDWSGRART